MIALEVGKFFGGASDKAFQMRGQGDPLGPGRTSAGAMLGSLGFNPSIGRNKVKH